MAHVLDCTAVAQAIKEKCRAEADALRAKGITPKLGILRVGEKGPDLSYEKGATKAMNECNVEVQVVALPADVSQEEYIKTIRAMDRADAKTIPIIALTANAFDEDVQRSLQAGLDAHLTKPIEQEKLFDTLERLLCTEENN